MKILEKKLIVAKTHSLIKKSNLIMIIEHLKMKSLEVKRIRNALFKENINVKILKNTLAKKAFQGTHAQILNDNIFGQLMMVFGQDKISVLIKIIDKFRKEYSCLKIRNIYMYGQLFAEKDIKYLINIPTKLTAIYNLVINIKSPIINIINNLKYPYIKLITLLNNSKIKGE